jgi:hypothetical protein
LVNMFVEDRLPNLADAPEKVPPIRKSDNEWHENEEE